jgi:hypothetical protein
VAVIEDDFLTVNLELVQAARRLEERCREGAQPLADVVQVRARGPRRGRRSERIGHVHARAPGECGRDEVRVQQRHRPAGMTERDDLAVVGLLDDHRRATAPAVAVDAVGGLGPGRGHREVHDVAA